MSHTPKLFENEVKAQFQPLAEKLRPVSWEQFLGLEKINKQLWNRLQDVSKRPPSLILWGPPGSGKTTLARIIGKTHQLPFYELSAIFSGVKDLRAILSESERHTSPSLLFIDEIHRYNKAQQDAFLPYVEKGRVILIGATTENPSFDLNQALLSRCQVLQLPSIEEKNLKAILEKAAEYLKIEFEPEAEAGILSYSLGDARRLLNLIENLSFTGETKISSQLVTDTIQNSTTFRYDKDGEEHYNLASAFIKSLRGSDLQAAMYWGFRMLESGEDPKFLIRRMMIFASEDIGNLKPNALVLAVSTLQAYENLGMPEARIPIAQCIEYLATAPKGNSSYMLMHQALSIIRQCPNEAVPLKLRNAPTKLMKSFGYGEGYKYPHDHGGFIAGEDYLPPKVKKAFNKDN